MRIAFRAFGASVGKTKHPSLVSAMGANSHRENYRALFFAGVSNSEHLREPFMAIQLGQLDFFGRTPHNAEVELFLFSLLPISEPLT